MLRSHTRTMVVLALLAVSGAVFGEDECDDPDAPEKVRIYFGNGMNTHHRGRLEGRGALQNLIGISSSISYGSSVNSREPFWFQILEVARQRALEARDTWYYVDHPEIERNPIRDDVVQVYRNSANIQYVLDPELRKMVSDYVADMNSGKKVVVVAHSQGNYYANSAYRYIVSHYPEFKDSIGLVAVGTPTVRVEDGGKWHQNGHDDVINDVRRLESQVLAPTFYYREPLLPNVIDELQPNNHSFESTYIAAVGSAIRQSVNETITRLKTPDKKPECENPDDVPVKFGPIYIDDVTVNSARSWSEVESGKDLFVWGKLTQNSPPAACVSDAGGRPEVGDFNEGDIAEITWPNLVEDREYYVRMCAKGTLNRVSDTGSTSFRTASLDPIVKTADPKNVSSAGFTMGTSVTQGSNVTVSGFFISTDSGQLEGLCATQSTDICNNSHPKIDSGKSYYWRVNDGDYFRDIFGGGRFRVDMSAFTYYTVGCGCKNNIVASGTVKRVN